MTLFNRIRFLILLCMLPQLVSAQTFTNEQYGYSIELDDRYQLSKNTDAGFFRSNNSGVVIIKNWPGLTEEVLRDYLQQGYQDEVIALVSEGEPETVSVENGKGLLVDIEGIVERKRIKGVAGGYYGESGQGLVVLVSAQPHDWEQVEQEAGNILASVKLGEAVSHFDARDWWYMLAGTRLVRRDSAAGNQVGDDIAFCGDGGFYRRISYSSAAHGNSGSYIGFRHKQKSGDWYVISDDKDKPILVLRDRHNRENHISIEDRMGQTFLDGQRYFMLRNDRCH